MSKLQFSEVMSVESLFHYSRTGWTQWILEYLGSRVPIFRFLRAMENDFQKV